MFRKTRGEVTSRKAVVIDGDGVKPSLPSQFKSCQRPVRADGTEVCSAAIAPSGSSLPKATKSGRKLRQKSSERMIASQSAAHPRGFFIPAGRVAAARTGAAGLVSIFISVAFSIGSVQ